MEEELRPARVRAVTWRAVALGLLIAVTVAVLAPYNDYVVNNGFAIGNYLPPVVTLLMIGVVLLLNGPVHRFAPRRALSPGELAVAMAMGLIACSVPTQGLLRQLLPLPVVPFHFTERADYAKLFHDMRLPPWLWAVDEADGSRSRVVTAFYGRLTPGEPLPWSAWVRPLVGWGSFAACFLCALFSLALILRFQWTVNERLPFPIAQVQSMLIAAPPPGRAFNDLFSSRGFWIALAAVMAIESSAALHQYFPNVVPVIPYDYDLTASLSEQPWSYLPPWMKANSIYFTFLGLSYFTTTRVSFSLWGSAVGMALLVWVLDPTKTVVPDAAQADQAMGASFAFLAGVLWIGRTHWATVLRALVGRSRPGDARAAFVPYRRAAIALLVGVSGMFGWLLFVGVGAWLAAGVVLMILIAHVVTARVVAETGLACLRVAVPFDSLLKALPTTLLTPRDAFIYGVGHYGFMQAARESELVFALHGLNVVDATQPPGGTAGGSSVRRGTASALIGALVVTLIACTIASLYFYYTHALPLAYDEAGVLNKWGLINWPQTYLVDFPTQVAAGLYAARSHNPWTHLAVGIGVMTVLQALTWRFNNWPLLPVGYLLCTSWYMTFAWFSLLLGWLAKVLILRFGGARLFNDLKPVFVGMIIGEAMTVGLWLLVTLVRALSGDAFFVVKFLPQ